jgi:hypothetical protein
VQSVRAPALSSDRRHARSRLGAVGRGRARSRTTLAALATVLALALALGFAADQLLTGAAPTPASHAARLALLGGRPLQQARCAQWLTASTPQRTAAIAALHGVVGGPTSWGPATALSPTEATTLFQRTCAHGYARNFLLYELYTRAAGFRSLAHPRPGV